MFMFFRMRILHVSDVHGNVSAVEKISKKAVYVGADLIIVTGDLTHFGEIEDAEMILEKIFESSKRVFFVPGNCDPRALLDWNPKNPSIKNLHLKSAEFMGWEFIGLGGAVGRLGTLTEFTEEEVEDMLSKVTPRRPGFVFISHSPPYGLEVDYTGTKHIGSIAVKKYIENYRPRLMLCGHAHEGRGMLKLGEVTIINSGPAKNGLCSTIDLGRDVEVQLTTLY